MFCHFSYNVVIGSSSNILGPEIPQETNDTFRQHLSSYNFWALTGWFSSPMNCTDINMPYEGAIITVKNVHVVSSCTPSEFVLFQPYKINAYRNGVNYRTACVIGKRSRCHVNPLLN